MSRKEARTLVSNPISQDKIPAYPSFELLKAEGGEDQYDLESPEIEDFDNYVFNWNDPPHIDIVKRKAEKGEILRTPRLLNRTSVKKNLLYRLKLRERCKDDKDFRKYQYRLCASDILYFINSYVWTFDPREPTGMRKLPFVTYEFQDEAVLWLLWCVKEQRDGIIEKSREMGLSWLLQAVITYCVIFSPGFTSLQLSLTKEDVDNKTIESLLGKFRYIMANLPEWLRAGWIEGYKGMDNIMNITVPDSESAVLGALTGGSGGRGWRSSLTFLDEFAFNEDASNTLMSNTSQTYCSIFLSTPNGMDNSFARMANKKNARKMSLHWKKHPRMSKRWAILEMSGDKMTEEIWAQERDIDYDKSSTARVFPKFVSYVHDPTIWRHVQNDRYYDYDANYPVHLGIDLGISDPQALVAAQVRPVHEDWKKPGVKGEQMGLFFFYEQQKQNQDIFELAADIQGMIRTQDNPYGWELGRIVLDWRSATARNQLGATSEEYFNQVGLHPVGVYSYEGDQLNEAKLMQSKPGKLAIYGPGCHKLIEACQQWSYQTVKGVKKPGAKPMHNKYSHIMKAKLYLIYYLSTIDRLWSGRKETKGDWSYNTVKSSNFRS